MPSYNFGDSTGKIYTLVPDDVYKLEVTDVTFGISKGKKTNGCETATVVFSILNQSASTRDTFQFHESVHWKMDLFLKAFDFKVDGVIPKKGEPIEFTKDSLVGLRGWARVKPGEKKSDGKQYNEIVFYVIDRPKLPRADVDEFDKA